MLFIGSWFLILQVSIGAFEDNRLIEDFCASSIYIYIYIYIFFFFTSVTCDDSDEHERVELIFISCVGVGVSPFHLVT